MGQGRPWYQALQQTGECYDARTDSNRNFPAPLFGGEACPRQETKLAIVATTNEGAHVGIQSVGLVVPISGVHLLHSKAQDGTLSATHPSTPKAHSSLVCSMVAPESSWSMSSCAQTQNSESANATSPQAG